MPLESVDEDEDDSDKENNQINSLVNQQRPALPGGFTELDKKVHVRDPFCLQSMVNNASQRLQVVDDRSDRSGLDLNDQRQQQRTPTGMQSNPFAGCMLRSKEDRNRDKNQSKVSDYYKSKKRSLQDFNSG